MVKKSISQKIQSPKKPDFEETVLREIESIKQEINEVKAGTGIIRGIQKFERGTEGADASKTTVKELLKIRGIVDRNDVIGKAAQEYGFDIDKCIDDFIEDTVKQNPELSVLYIKPDLSYIEDILELGRGGQVATVAVMAVAVAVVAVAAAAIAKEVKSNLISQVFAQTPDENIVVDEVNRLIQ